MYYFVGINTVGFYFSVSRGGTCNVDLNCVYARDSQKSRIYHKYLQVTKFTGFRTQLCMLHTQLNKIFYDVLCIS
jgi:DNA primase catalytic subunit